MTGEPRRDRTDVYPAGLRVRTCLVRASSAGTQACALARRRGRPARSSTSPSPSRRIYTSHRRATIAVDALERLRRDLGRQTYRMTFADRRIETLGARSSRSSLNLADRQTASIQADHAIVEPDPTGLTLADDLRLKSCPIIPRGADPQQLPDRSGSSCPETSRSSRSLAPPKWRLTGLIAQMLGQLGTRAARFRHPARRAAPAARPDTAISSARPRAHRKQRVHTSSVGLHSNVTPHRVRDVGPQPVDPVQRSLGVDLLGLALVGEGGVLIVLHMEVFLDWLVRRRSAGPTARPI